MSFELRSGIIIIIFIIISSGLCKEVAYSYGVSGGHPLDSGNLTEYKGSDIVTSAVTSASPNGRSISVKSKTVEEIKKEIDLKLNVGNPTVRDKGRKLILEYPGDGTVSQICSIYDHMVGNWSYARDTRGIEEFQYSNKSLDYGQGRFSGQGDCDDFSILLASLIESIGGTSRIMLAYGSNGGHAYTEVYLGKAGGVDSDVDRMIKWLRSRYHVPEINTHINLDTEDVWLNLDWWKDPNTGADLIKHPGGPFFNAANQTPILVREDVPMAPLEPLNDPPIAQFNFSPTNPNEGEPITFDASSSRDVGIGGQIERYLWNFGDEGEGEGEIVTHTYSQGDRYQAKLVVTDNDGAQNSTMQTVEVNALPTPIIDYQPKEPKTGDSISFDASKSYDKEDGKVFGVLWEFGDESTAKRSRVSHSYDECGNYLINLTAYDKSNAGNTTSLILKINEPPVAKFSFSTGHPNRYPNEEEAITFDASESKDQDGNITAFKWNFDDGSLPEFGKSATHSYAAGGNFTVSLEITDDSYATATENKTLRINWLPVARISPIASNHATNEDIIFNASNSSDNESEMLRYSWDFNDDNIIDSGAKRDAHDYKLSGKYRAKLTVTDENDASNSTYIDLTVEEPSPKSPVDSIALDYNVDRRGSDYRSFGLSSADPKLCADACAADPDCEAFSYNPPGMEGPNAKCWLKNAIPAQVAADDVVSGAKASTANAESISNYWGHYSAKGTDYFTGYIDGLLYEQSDDKTLKGCISKVLINEKRERTITSNTPVFLSDGYRLAIKNIDPDGIKVYLELTKNEEVVETKAISPSMENTTEADKTYYYRNPQVGRQKNLITIAVHFKNAFRSSDTNLATVDAVWQISDEADCS